MLDVFANVLCLAVKFKKNRDLRVLNLLLPSETFFLIQSFMEYFFLFSLSRELKKNFINNILFHTRFCAITVHV